MCYIYHNILSLYKYLSNKMAAHRCSLIIDTRERNVTRHITEFTNINVEIKQITIGDYIVTGPSGNILAVIERKSLSDFAASLKDGRHHNKSKMIELRKTTGCRILYIIEGPEFPSENSLHSGIPYRYIESSIFHLIMRDGISILRSKDTLQTAKLLSRFVTSVSTLVKKMNTANIEPAVVKELTNEEINPVGGSSMQETFASITQRHEKTDIEITRELWSCFRGISIESADCYINKWSIADIIGGKLTVEEISAHKLSTGKKISKRVVTSLTKFGRLIEIKLLSTVPGISTATATELLANNELYYIIAAEQTLIANITVGKSKRKLGIERVGRIQRCFNYKFNVNGIMINTETSRDPVNLATQDIENLLSELIDD